jgi:hypothetical protein
MRRKTYARLQALNLKLAGRFTSGIASDLERLQRRIAPRGTVTSQGWTKQDEDARDAE